MRRSPPSAVIDVGAEERGEQGVINVACCSVKRVPLFGGDDRWSESSGDPPVNRRRERDSETRGRHGDRRTAGGDPRPSPAVRFDCGGESQAEEGGGGCEPGPGRGAEPRAPGQGVGDRRQRDDRQRDADDLDEATPAHKCLAAGRMGIAGGGEVVGRGSFSRKSWPGVVGADACAVDRRFWDTRDPPGL